MVVMRVVNLQMLQLRRVRQPHRGQVHDGPPAEEVPQLQERGPPDRRLSDESGASPEVRAAVLRAQRQRRGSCCHLGSRRQT
jgi:hypothetical protein